MTVSEIAEADGKENQRIQYSDYLYLYFDLICVSEKSCQFFALFLSISVFMFSSFVLKRELTTFFSNYPPQWLRKKWLEVKRKAPDYHQMEFEGTLLCRL